MGPDWHFLPPKYNGLKIDAHTHLHLGPNGDFTGFDKVLNVADANHITQIAAIIDEKSAMNINRDDCNISNLIYSVR